MRPSSHVDCLSLHFSLSRSLEGILLWSLHFSLSRSLEGILLWSLHLSLSRSPEGLLYEAMLVYTPAALWGFITGLYLSTRFVDALVHDI